MNELITRIEKLKPHTTEAITLFFNFEDMTIKEVSDMVKHLSNKFPENTVIAIPDKASLESCSKDVLENIISMISEIMEKL
jgi:hypothetical protein